jgi:hypothetical protein
VTTAKSTKAKAKPTAAKSTAAKSSNVGGQVDQQQQAQRSQEVDQIGTAKRAGGSTSSRPEQGSHTSGDPVQNGGKAVQPVARA